MGVFNYSPTPGSNTTISGINIAENCNASGINDAIRQMMADISTFAGQTQNGSLNWIAAGGTADALTATYSPALTTLVDGQLCFVRSSAANATTTPTFSPNGLTARTITRSGGNALAIGDIPGALAECILRYNLANTRWELLNPVTPLNPSNKIINGGMVLDQRNAGASVTPVSSPTYLADRWNASFNVSSKFSAQQNGGSLSAPPGQAFWLCATSLSAYTIGASESFSIVQNIEGSNVADLEWGTANAKTVTLSFLVQSTLTGTFGGSIVNAAVNRSYPFTYSIPVANTWTQISIVIPGDTSGTWLKTNGVGLAIFFSLGAHSNLSGSAGAWAGATYLSATGAINVVSTNAAKLAITAVDLKANTVYSPFVHDDFAVLLYKCRRYFRKTFPMGTAPAQNTGSALGTLGDISPNSAQSHFVFWSFDPPMRTAPTITMYSPTNASNNWVEPAGPTYLASVTNAIGETGAILCSGAGSTAGRFGQVHATADAEL